MIFLPLQTVTLTHFIGSFMEHEFYFQMVLSFASFHDIVIGSSSMCFVSSYIYFMYSLYFYFCCQNLISKILFPFVKYYIHSSFLFTFLFEVYIFEKKDTMASSHC